MKTYLILFAFLLNLSLAAQNRNFTLPLSDGQGSSMEVFLPDSAHSTGRMIVICPGGGYVHLAIEHEGRDWAPFFNEKGIACAVVKYRMPEGNPQVPADDAEAAIAKAREHAAEWQLNPKDIGIMGFSAGGHLASTVATKAAPASRPNFQILFYPVITMEHGDRHDGSRRSLLGNRADEPDVLRRFSCENTVNSDTPPAILLLSGDDTVVPPAGNAVAYYKALHAHHVRTTLHIYPTGGHGWGMRNSFAHHAQMLTDLSYWLENLATAD